MIYYDEKENEIGSLGDMLGWIEATGYTGRVLAANRGRQPMDVTEAVVSGWRISRTASNPFLKKWST